MFLLFNYGFAELVYLLALESPLQLCFTFQMFLYVLPSSFYASVLFRHMLGQTEITSLTKIEVLDAMWYFK